MAASFSDAGSVTYTDKMNRKVSIPVPVEKAVFFETYELVPSLDIWDKVVGVSRFAFKNDLILAARPDIEKQIPSAGSGGDINMELLLKIKPDIVITWAFNPDAVRFVEEKGLNIIALYPESVAELYEVMRFLGEIFDRKMRAEAVIAEMESIFNHIHEKSAAMDHDMKKKAIWLGGKRTSVSCGSGINNNLIQMVGAVNPAGHLNQRSADISLEQIIVWNPDVIFIWGFAGYTPQDIIANAQWRFISAVREGRVFKSPGWSTWSPRLAPVALWMAKKTYPEYYTEIDIDKITDEFYKKVFNISYSEVKPFEN